MINFRATSRALADERFVVVAVRTGALGQAHDANDNLLLPSRCWTPFSPRPGTPRGVGCASVAVTAIMAHNDDVS